MFLDDDNTMGNYPQGIGKGKYNVPNQQLNLNQQAIRRALTPAMAPITTTALKQRTLGQGRGGRRQSRGDGLQVGREGGGGCVLLVD